MQNDDPETQKNCIEGNSKLFQEMSNALRTDLQKFQTLYATFTL